MTRSVKKTGLLVSVSTIALGMFAIASSASAFNEVNWTWNALVDENVVKTVDINIDIAPTGLVMLEDLQLQVGNVTATSTVTGITNNQPQGATAGGPQVIDLGTLQTTGTYDPTTGIVTDGVNASVLTGATFLSGVVNPGSPYGVTENFDLGTITVQAAPGEAVAPLDALTQLPEVVSAATAVGNNTSITADTAVELHETQIVVGAGTAFGENGLPTVGSMQLAAVNASSTVSDILNASVDSTATAVGNNLTVAIEAAGPDRLLMADVTQLSAANVTATSDVSGVEVNNYINLGSLGRPLVSSVATAVGNNKSISVNAPAVTVNPAP